MQTGMKNKTWVYGVSLSLLMMVGQTSAQAEAAITKIPDFSAIHDVKQKKARFFNFMRPVVAAENQKLMTTRTWLTNLKTASMSQDDAKKMMALADKYNIKKINDNAKVKKLLLNRVDEVPASLVLVQSANESSWGTSHFAKQGFNFFGQWCFTKGCGIVPKRRGKGMTHEVRKFSSVNESVQAYLFNLNTNNAFKELRKIRAETRAKHKNPTGYALAAGLIHYSERKHAYIKEIRAMIRQNKLGQYDALAK